jgi:hypothetical protein
VTIVFNDHGGSSKDPCGFVVGQECDGAQYAAWWRAMSSLSGQLAIIELEADPASRVLATAYRAEFQVFPSPSNLLLRLAPVGRTKALAKLVQNAVDLIEKNAELPGNPEIPTGLLEAPTQPLPSGPGFLAGLSTGTVLTIAALAGGVWYARSRDWI